jgi:hypothetical protein
MKLGAAAIAATAVLAPASASAQAGTLGCHRGWPVVAYRATATGTEVAHVPRLPVSCGIATGYPTSETTLAVTSRGGIVFSPANSENTLALSVNGGGSWQLVGPTELQYTSLWNTVDPQVVLDRRTGRLFWIHTTYTEDLRWPLPDQSPASWFVPTVVANAHGFQVYRSADSGRSWRTADYSHEDTADWEKLFVGPPARGGPQPSQYPDVVYMCANAPVEVIGVGRECYRSLDGGATFTSIGYVTPSATAPGDCPALAANTGAVGPDGTVYIPQSCAGGTYLAVSHDEGGTFNWLQVPGAPSDTGLGAVAQLTVDAAGNLYVLWLSSDTLELVSSRDEGRTWSGALAVSPPGLHNITLPALAAGGRGQVGVVFYASTNPAAKQLSGYIAETDEAAASSPLFYAATVNNPSHPIFENYGQGTSPRADFIGGTYDRDGQLWGGLVEQLGPPDSGNRIATTGYVAHLATIRARPRHRVPSRHRSPNRGRGGAERNRRAPDAAGSQDPAAGGH